MIAKPRFEVNSQDLHNLISSLNSLPKNVRNRAIRIGLNKAGSIMRSHFTTATVPVDTGKLLKSFSVKVKQTKKTGDWAATVGANRRAGVRKSKKITRAMVTFFQPKSPETKKKRRTPANYLHLVNNGTKRGVKGKFFMQAALGTFDPAAIQVVKNRIIQEISTGAK